MKKHKNDILQEFDDCKIKLQDFGDTVYQLLKSLLSHYGAKPHQLTYRIKERASLEKKLVRKNYKYKTFNELTDLVGFRIITYFEDDIDKIAELINKEFQIDKENSIDKRQLETDKFGYRSLHFVFSIRAERLKLTEYKKFAGLKAEIQIRSILQHSWAEIEHDLGYKGAGEIPKTARRTFYRVAALLEQADIEFVKLREQVRQYEQSIKEQIQLNPASVTIDKAALLSFISESDALQKIEAKLQNESIPQRENPNDFVISGVLPRLEKLNITTIKELEDLYKEHEKEMIEFIRTHIKEYEEKYKKSPEKFVAGASLIWLCSVLES
ncbi:RelA/SpoT domain-containing protein [Pontibacter sp. H259]|uniref:GTP pyrophosphokinase n=1 Tax=Pontibacter sp. H259 TaxID=3133421 RepID=UPI0030BD69E7